MKFLVILLVAFSLVSLVFSRPMPEDEEGGTEEEGAEEAGDDAGSEGGDESADDAGGEDGGEETGGDDAGGSGGDGQNDPANTYKEVVALLDKDTKVDNIQSEYLRPALDNTLQAELRNPVVEAIGKVGDYSKIQECFKSMGTDVKKVVDEEEKTFKDCNAEKKSEYECSEASTKSAKDKIAQITTQIKSCVSSKGN
ncbi:30 kDa salivary gland allergen Aed a 3-like [Armigeres subalbatus]|uniref:30 kDa salivary gland allergen Aed a 3-like n=1 Tax=Armigeres subalbatus TaxID=124917 RepID=UPI002ED1C39E